MLGSTAYSFPEGSAIGSTVVARGHAGYGSAFTYVKRFSSAETSGSGIIYRDSPSEGSSFRVQIPGLYMVTYCDTGSAGQVYFGVTVNNAANTTAAASLTFAQGLRALAVNKTANGFVSVGIPLALYKGDTVRVSGDTGALSSGAIFTMTLVNPS